MPLTTGWIYDSISRLCPRIYPVEEIEMSPNGFQPVCFGEGWLLYTEVISYDCQKLFACDDCSISKARSCLIEDQVLLEWIPEENDEEKNADLYFYTFLPEMLNRNGQLDCCSVKHRNIPPAIPKHIFITVIVPG